FTLALPLGWSARAGAPRPTSPLRVSRKRMTALKGAIPDQIGPCKAESEHATAREHQRCHLPRASASGYKRRQGALLMAVKNIGGKRAGRCVPLSQAGGGETGRASAATLADGRIS